MEKDISIKSNQNEEIKDFKKNFLDIRLSDEVLLKLKDIMINIKTRNQLKAIKYCINMANGEIIIKKR